MFEKEKTGLRRLWDYKPGFYAAISAHLATLGLLAAAYMYYLPNFVNMKPFAFLLSVVLRWLLLALPAYLLSAYLEDHYATERSRRFVITAGISALGLVAQIVLNWNAFVSGLLSGLTDQLPYSLALILALVATVIYGVSQLAGLSALICWIFAGISAAAMILWAVVSGIFGNIPSLIAGISYAVLCVSYCLALPGILNYQPPEEDEEPEEAPLAPIMKDEE